ncbi:unnamed protein product [Arctogadus glacialis]
MGLDVLRLFDNVAPSPRSETLLIDGPYCTSEDGPTPCSNLEFAVDYIKFSKDFGLPSLHLVQKSKIVDPAGQV